MRILSVVHGGNVREGVFGEPVRERGHELVEWRPASGELPRPLDDFDAVLVFGGAMHADQEDQHPWLREEHALMERLSVVLVGGLHADAPHSSGGTGRAL